MRALQQNLNYEKRVSLEQTATLLESRCAPARTVQQICQSSTALLDFLNGSYYSAFEEVFAYNHEIRPMFIWNFINSTVDDIKIYRTHHSPHSYLKKVPYFEYLEDFPSQELLEELQRKNSIYLWEFPQEESPMLVCYANLYNKEYSKVVGICEVRLKAEVLFQNMDYFREGECRSITWREKEYPVILGENFVLGNEEAGELGVPYEFSLTAPIANTDTKLTFYYQQDHDTMVSWS